MVVVRGYLLTPVPPQVTRKILFRSSLDREVLSKSSFQLNSSEEAVPQLEVSEISSSPSEAPPPSELSRTRRVLSKINPFKKDDEEPLKQKLLKLGLAAFLSYGFVSNMTYAVLLSCSYFVFTKKTGITPLAPGQRANFLAVYTGFFVLNNFLRPVRLAVAASFAPYMERVIVKIQKKLNCSRAVATGVVVFLFNVVGTLSAMYAGLNLAAIFSGVPVEFSRLIR
ncbi:hypothetical protein TrCOL_g10520 [Triparma columacea]|uniref:Uncharacterized protein n=1 Tax=Triparma columacea TaxID=722753 RepID=A0A9W7GPR1_9STRA|nr:hypothetical protein TrCOL_g10520 [Triparma columacea]